MASNRLTVGDPAPRFRQRSGGNPSYVFDTAAGRYILLCFLATGADGHAQAAIAAVRGRPDLFDDSFACFFGVSNDAQDEGRLAEHYPGYRYFWDFDLTIAKLYGAADATAEPGTRTAIRRHWVLLDPMLRALAVIPFQEGGADIAEVIAILERQPPPARFAGFEVPAPVLILPNILEPELCRTLIGLYEKNGGTQSGFMRDIAGKTVSVHDGGHKRRRDYDIDDPRLIELLQHRVRTRINPEIAKAYNFLPTRMERYIVGCYSAEDRGHFRPHRDNTTHGTAHRRFAVSINLNDDFEGGRLSFPEYGTTGYCMPAGGAAVFSCALLHTVSPVTAGQRYAFLPFLYDEAAARVREANNPHLGAGLTAYRAAPGDEDKQGDA